MKFLAIVGKTAKKT